MRFALVVVLQLVLSVLLLGALLPAVLYAVPAARGPKAGMATAAALLRAFDASFDRPPEMTVHGVGIGLGHRELSGRPNLLRVVAGDAAAGASARTDVARHTSGRRRAQARMECLAWVTA
mgnify:CR=1 FL=1